MVGPVSVLQRERLLKSQEALVVIACLFEVADVIGHMGHADNSGLLLGLRFYGGKQCRRHENYRLQEPDFHKDLCFFYDSRQLSGLTARADKLIHSQ